MNSPGQPGYGHDPYPQEVYRRQQPAGSAYQPGPAQPTPYWPDASGQQRAPPAQPPYHPAPPAPSPQQAARPQPANRRIPVVTTAEVPGHRIASVVGDVLGVVTRSRPQPPAPGQHAGAQAAYDATLTSSRQDAIGRMAVMARDAGAHAVVGMRFDSTEIGPGVSEVVAYGTAVMLVDERAASGQQGTETAAAGSADQPPDGSPHGDGNAASAPGWWPRSGSGTLLGDPESTQRHATVSPALPGRPHPDG